MRVLAGAVLGALAVLSRAPVTRAQDAAGDGAPPRIISYYEDSLTVRIAKMPVTDVLAEVGRQSGAEVRGDVKVPRDVSAEFEGVPVAEALHRLLGNENFALIYTESGKLKAIQLLGAPLASAGGATPTAAGVVPAAAPPPGGQSTADLMAAVENHLPIPVSGRLAQVMGTESATLRQLVEIGLHYEDASVRAEAIRTALQVIENEPGFRATVLNTVNNIDEPGLVVLLRGSAGERAEEIAMHVATQSRVAELRTKASAVLQRLRSGS